MERNKHVLKHIFHRLRFLNRNAQQEHDQRNTSFKAGENADCTGFTESPLIFLILTVLTLCPNYRN